MKELYVFKIGLNVRPVNNHKITQDKARDDMKQLLEICQIEFELYHDEEKNAKWKVYEQEFTFETPEECRTFALRILNTNVIFFCELKKVNVND